MNTTKLFISCGGNVRDFGTISAVPQANGPIRRACHNSTIRAKADGNGRAGMSFELCPFFTVGHIPQVHRVIRTRSSKPFAIGAEAHFRLEAETPFKPKLGGSGKIIQEDATAAYVERQQRTIRAERHIVRTVAWVNDRSNRLCGNIPQDNIPIELRNGKRGTIRADGNSARFTVAEQHGRLTLGRKIGGFIQPDADCPVHR